MKAIFGLLFGFGLALAVVLGQRMGADGGASVLGVFAGIVASFPVVVVLVLLHRANERQTKRTIAGIVPQNTPERATGHPWAFSDAGARYGATVTAQGVSTRPQGRADILPPYVHHRGEVVIDLDESEYRRFGFDVPGQRVRRYRGYRSGDASAAVPIIETLTPARAPDVRSDFLTPMLQSLFSGIVGALAAAVVAWKTGGDVVTWLIVGFVAALAVSWAVSLGLVRELLWKVERITGDLDGDGVPGKPETYTMLENPGKAREQVSKVVEEQSRRTSTAAMLAFWQKCVNVGTSTRDHGARPGTKALEDYERARDMLIQLGLAQWRNEANHRAGWDVTTDLAMGARIIGEHVRTMRQTRHN